LRARLAAIVAVLALLAVASSVTSAAAEEPQTFTVHVGAQLNDSGGGQVGRRFYPEALTVAPGDIIRFQAQALHTATLLPISVDDPEAWLSANAPARGGEWSLFHSDPDERGVKMNPGVVGASETTCSNPFVPMATGVPCAFDGTDELGILHSGLPVWGAPLDYMVEVTAPVGESFFVQDLVDTDMRMTVSVNETAPQTPDEVAAAVSAAVATDSRDAQDLHAQWLAEPVTKRNAVAGVETEDISLNHFYPETLTIKKGQRVKWSFDELDGSSHTVTFPGSFAGAAWEIVCDKDGDAGTTKDQPRTGESPMALCESADETEFDITKQYAKNLTDGKWKNDAKEFDGSGARGVSPLAASAKPWTLAFPTVGKGFTYRSLMAPAMTAKVKVKV
jgi:plastocyanin